MTKRILHIDPACVPGRGHDAIVHDSESGEIMLGAISSVPDGTDLRTLPGDLFRYDESRRTFDEVEVPRAPSTSGPAQVATPAYRDGYDRIFGRSPTVGQA